MLVIYFTPSKNMSIIQLCKRTQELEVLAIFGIYKYIKPGLYCQLSHEKVVNICDRVCISIVYSYNKALSSSCFYYIISFNVVTLWLRLVLLFFFLSCCFFFATTAAAAAASGSCSTL